MKLNVFNFSDYRSFLLSYVVLAKAQNPRWTMGVWARRLGLKATSTISKVLSGTRNPGERFVEQLVTYFQFNEQEALHFRRLVNLERYKRNPEIVEILKGLTKTEPSAS